MGQTDEIDFETTDAPDWRLVREGAHGVARERIDVRYKGVIQGASDFKNSASQLLVSSIRKPPEDISVLGAIVNAVSLASTLVVPEAGLAAEIAKAVKESYEALKSSSEVLDKIGQMRKAESVESAVEQLTTIADDMAEDVEHVAGDIQQQALDSVGAALDSYVSQNPQVLRRDDDAFYGELCDAIGITKPDFEDVSMAAWRRMFTPFRERVLQMAATLHFFTEMDDDAERLNFLMDQADEGNDPDALLALIGGDSGYWDRFLAVYKASGRSAAQAALLRHLAGG
jgi:hypothetical protein